MVKPKIFITRKLPEELLRPYENIFNITTWSHASTPIPREKLLQEVKNVDGLFCMLSDRIDDELFNHAPNLKIVANLAVGYDNINLEAES